MNKLAKELRDSWLKKGGFNGRWSFATASIEELLSQLDLLTQIQTQLTQNRGKNEILQGLQKEFEVTLDQIQERLSSLSPSRVGSVLGTLDALQGQLSQLVTNLQQNAPQDTVRQTSAAVATLIARLQQDLLPQRLR